MPFACLLGKSDALILFFFVSVLFSDLVIVIEDAAIVPEAQIVDAVAVVLALAQNLVTATEDDARSLGPVILAKDREKSSLELEFESSKRRVFLLKSLVVCCSWFMSL
jgi:hypothetical protein